MSTVYVQQCASSCGIVGPQCFGILLLEHAFLLLSLTLFYLHKQSGAGAHWQRYLYIRTFASCLMIVVTSIMIPVRVPSLPNNIRQGIQEIVHIALSTAW